MANQSSLVLVSSGSTEGALQLSSGDVVAVGTESWFNWLRDNSSFRFESGFAGENSFTARKHERYAGEFWYAYRKVDGRVRNAYLGKAERLTVGRMLEIAVKLLETPKQSANKQQLGNGYATESVIDQLPNNQPADCITGEVMQQKDEKIAVLLEENQQMRLHLQELQNQVSRLEADHETRMSVLAVGMENVKSNSATKLIKAVKQAYPELA